jgi:putative oxidoreductase
MEKSMDFKQLLKSNPSRYDLSLALVRVVIGLTFFMHGWQKLFDNGIGGVTGFFDSLGVPAAGLFAVLVTLLELLGGLALILGIGTRIVAALLAIDMLVALLLVHISNGFFVGNGGIELVLLLGVSAVAFVLSGAGAYSLDSRFG